MERETAMKILKELHDNSLFSNRTALETLIPELADSNDERIRKALIDALNKNLGNGIEKYGTTLNAALAWLEKQDNPQDKGEISDGYHTFNELYYYRMLYNAAFFNMLPKEWVHKSKRHNDGEECFGGGWFIVMANLPTGQISNHYELKDWDLFQIPEKEVADKWDGHTPQEAADRLHKYLLEKQSEQKPAEWSKEDENRLQNIIACIEDCYNEKDAQDLIRWFKSLRHQPKQEWSDEDELVVLSIEQVIKAASLLNIVPEKLDKIDKWLKSLKDRIGG